MHVVVSSSFLRYL